MPGAPVALATEPDLVRRARALDRVNAAVVVVDTAGTILDWTDGAGRLLGFERSAVVGRSWADIAGPVAEDPDPRRAEMLERRMAGLPYRGELTVMTAAGIRIPVLVEGAPIHDDAGQVAGSVAVILDDRRRSAAEERFETAFRAAPIASIMTIPPRHLILDVNPAFETLTGHAHAAAVGRTPTELDLWGDPSTRGDLVARTADGGAIPEMATRVRTASGVLMDVRLSGRPILASGGPAYLWMAVDETERVRAEASLRATASRLMAIVDASPMAIVLIDRARLVGLWNPAAETLFGWTASEVLGRRIPLEAEAPDAARSLIDSVLGGVTVRDDQLSVVRRDGVMRRISVASAPIRDADGAIVGALTMCADISEREELQASLREAQKMESIGFLAGGVAHDFNNIMTAVGGYATMAMDAIGPGHPATSDLQEVVRATERATALTRQLLTFSRRQATDPEVIDLGAEVRGLEPLLRRAMSEDVDIRIDAGDEPAWIRADRTQIQQALLNLAVNARDAMPQGGRLRIAVTTDSGGDDGPASGSADDGTASRTIRLDVADTGHGMDATVIEHAFEPFYTTKGPGQGTGLGLAVVHGIVAGSGGRVALRSQPEAGTTVTMSWPAADPPESTARPQARASERQRTILVAEDETALRALAHRVLEMAGYRVIDAVDGLDALERAQEEPEIDLLLTDLTMPRMGGATLAARLTAERPGLRVLFMSGYGEDRLGGADPRDPAIRLLPKPFGVDALAEAVAAALAEQD